MRKPKTFICEKCKDEYYGDDLVFDLSSEGIGFVCENCFLHHAEKDDFCSEEDFEEYGWSGELLANKLDVYYTTAENQIDNEYDLMLEAKEEARRDMYL